MRKFGGVKGRAIALAMGIAALGCGGIFGGDGGSEEDQQDSANKLVQFSVTPGDQVVELDLDTPAQLPFQATAYYENGDVADVSAQAQWSIDDETVGTFDGASLAINEFASTTVVSARITASFRSSSAQAQVTVVAYRKTGDRTDFFFILPYEDPAGNQDKPLNFSTAIKSADVFFAMDATGSMGGEIANLQLDLNATVIPNIQSEIPDTQFGVGAYMDFPISPYGSLDSAGEIAEGCGHSIDRNDQPFVLLQDMTADAMLAQNAVNELSQPNGNPIGCGNDWPEAGIEAIYQVATGIGLDAPDPTKVLANANGVGGVGYRPGSMPVVIPISDAVSYSAGEAVGCEGISYEGEVAANAHSMADAMDSLDQICGKVVGVASMDEGREDCDEALSQQEQLASQTGARVPPEVWDIGTRPEGCGSGQCCTGLGGSGRAPDGDGMCPLVFIVDSTGAGLGAHIVTGIHMLTRFALFDAATETEGETESTDGVPLASGSTADFIKEITASTFILPPPPPGVPDPVANGSSFSGVTPGTSVSFEIVAYNDFVPATSEPQVFRATVRVVAGGCTDLDERDVFVVVPPSPIQIK